MSDAMRVLRILAIVLIAGVTAAAVSTLVYLRNRPNVIDGRGPQPAAGQAEGSQVAAQKAAASVVRIEIGTDASPVPGQSTPARGGTGIVVDPRGYLLTAQALVKGAPRLTAVFVDGKTLPARVIGSDPDLALTLLKVDVTNLQALSLGGGGLSLGAGVVVLAAPPALQVAVGAVAAQHATTSIDDPASPGRQRALNDLLALDVAVRDGELGAPVLDGAGRLMGVVVATGAEAWAYDISDAQVSVQQLLDSGHVSTPWLGFRYQQLSAVDAADRGVPGGVLVTDVEAGGPVDAVGVRPGDLVVSAGGQVLDPGHPLRRQLRDLAVKQGVSLVVRDGSGTSRTVSVPVELFSP